MSKVLVTGSEGYIGSVLMPMERLRSSMKNLKQLAEE